MMPFEAMEMSHQHREALLTEADNRRLARAARGHSHQEAPTKVLRVRRFGFGRASEPARQRRSRWGLRILRPATEA